MEWKRTKKWNRKGKRNGMEKGKVKGERNGEMRRGVKSERNGEGGWDESRE